jgi:hypothetical protein
MSNGCIQAAKPATDRSEGLCKVLGPARPLLGAIPIYCDGGSIAAIEIFPLVSIGLEGFHQGNRPRMPACGRERLEEMQGESGPDDGSDEQFTRRRF